MSGFKSGVTHSAMPTPASSKETALAIMDSLKELSGLFETDKTDSYIAPKFHTYKIVPNGLTSVYTGITTRLMTTAIFKDAKGVKNRMWLGECTCCEVPKRRLMTEVLTCAK